MALPVFLNLYRADNGALLGRVDLGDGLRAKSWLEELPRILLEAATARGLSDDGYGVLANFPFDASKTRSRPIGEALSAAPYTSIQLFKCVPQTQSLGLGDAAVTAWCDAALTEDDRTHADYYNTTTDPDDPVAPRGARAPAFLQTLVDGGGFNLAATNGTLSIRVNGTLYTVTSAVLQGTAVTVETIRDLIGVEGWPVDCQIEGTDTLRIFGARSGATQNIRAVCVAGDVGTVLFTGAAQSSQPNVMYYGTGSPLGQMDNSDVVDAMKPQRRILPGSLSITMTMGAEVVTATDNRLTGAITGSNVAATATVVGTIAYATGAVEFDTVGDAPDNATAVTARFDALIPIDLAEEVKMPAGASALALLVS